MFWYIRIFGDVYVLPVQPLHFCMMSVSCVLLTNVAVILFWVQMWRIFFSTIMKRSDVEPTDFWRLYFGHISFGTRVTEAVGCWTYGFLMVRLWSSRFMNYVGNSYSKHTIDNFHQKWTDKHMLQDHLISFFNEFICKFNFRFLFFWMPLFI